MSSSSDFMGWPSTQTWSQHRTAQNNGRLSVQEASSPSFLATWARSLGAEAAQESLDEESAGKQCNAKAMLDVNGLRSHQLVITQITCLGKLHSSHVMTPDLASAQKGIGAWSSSEIRSPLAPSL